MRFRETSESKVGRVLRNVEGKKRVKEQDEDARWTQSRGKWAWVSLGAALLAAGASMAVSVGGQYVFWDNIDFLDRSPFGRRGALDAFRSILSGDAYRDSAEYTVFQASSFFDILLFRRNPHLSHLLNLVIHLVNVALVWQCARRLLLRAAPLSGRQVLLAAGIAATLFGAHPVNVEPVAWVTGRKVELALLFSLCAFVLLLSPRGGRTRYFLAVAAYALALLSNAASFGLALVFGAWWTIVEGVRFRRALLLASPFLVLVAWAALMRARIDTPEKDVLSGKESRSRQIGACLAGRARETLDLVYPKDLAPIYHTAQGPSWSADSFAGILLMAASAVLIVWGWRQGASRRPQAGGANAAARARAGPFSLPAARGPLSAILAFGLAWYWLALAPTFAHHHTQLDRHMYCSAVGLFLAVGVLLTLAFARLGRGARAAFAAACCVAGLALCLASARQAARWRTDVALLEHTIAATKNNHWARFFLGCALANRGDLEGAAPQYRAALELAPDFSLARRALADALLRMGEADLALEQYRKVVDSEPDRAGGVAALASALVQLGRREEAEPLFRRAVELDPHYAQPRRELARMLLDLNRTDEAVAELTQALALDPDNAEAENELGGILMDLGRLDEARAHFEASVRLDRGNLDARHNLANLLLDAGRTEEAVGHYEALARLDPDSADVLHRLGVALFQLGRIEEAVERFEQALERDPENADIHCNLGMALASEGRRDEAIARFEKTLEIEPGYAPARAALDDLTRQRSDGTDAR